MSEEQVASDLVASVTGETPNAPVLDEGAEVPAFVPLQLNKVILTPEMMNDARKLYPEVKQKIMDEGGTNFPRNAGEFLARDLVDTFRYDFRDRVAKNPNYLTYEGLKNGTALILDEIPAYRGKSPKERTLTDDDIAKIFSNAEDAPLTRAFFGEFFKTLPAIAGGMEAASVAFTATPAPIPVKVGAAIASGIGAGFALYTAADQIEESILGPDPVVVEGQRAAFEAYRTLGGGAANILFPFMLGRYAINSGAQTVLDSVYQNAKGPLHLRMQAALDDMLTQTAKFARSGKKQAGITAAAEAAGASGSAIGAFFAESNEAGMGGRLTAEFLGGNLGAITLLKAIPKVMMTYDQVGGVSGMASRAGDAKQRAWFEKINDLYGRFGTPEQYDELVENLTSPAVLDELADAFPGVNFTVAQQSGDPLMMALEAGRITPTGKLDQARKTASRKATEFTINFIKALQEEGSEQSVKQAALLRSALFEERLEHNIQAPLNKLLTAVNKLQLLPGQEGAALSQTQISEKMFDIIDNQIFNAASKKSKQLYAAAGARDFPIYEPESEDIPLFLQVWDELSYKNPSVQKEFERAVPEITNFIRDSRAKLGLNKTQAADEVIESAEEAAARQAEIQKLDASLQKFREGIGNIDNPRDVYYGPYNAVKERVISENLTLNQQAAALEDLAEQFFEDAKGMTRGVIFEQGAKFRSFANSLVDEAKLLRLRGEIPQAVDTDNLAPVTAAEMDEIRSRALALARGFRSGLTPDKADYGGKLGEFANAIRLGLYEAEEGAPEAYKVAVAFTRAKHDVVSRLVGNNKLPAKQKSGARTVDPEVLLNDYISGNPSVTLLRTRNLQKLARFADKEGLPAFAANDDSLPFTEQQGSFDFETEGVDSVFTTVSNLAESYLRKTDVQKTYKQVFNKKTGKLEYVVDEARLQQWVDNNPELMEIFPQLKLDAQNAVTFQRSLEFAKHRKPRLEKLKKQQTQLGQLMSGVSPTVVIGEAFDSKNAAQSLRRVFSLITKAKDFGSRANPPSGIFKDSMVKSRQRIDQTDLSEADIKAGLRTAMMQEGLMRAGGEAGTFDPKTFYSFMFQPKKGMENTTLAELALKNGVLNQGEFDRLKFMSTQMLRMQAADNAGRLNDPNFVQEAGATLDFYYGITGSALGTGAYQSVQDVFGIQNSTGALSAAAAGRKFLVNIFQNVPAMQNLDVLEQIFTNAELTGKLLKRPTNAAEANRQSGKVATFLKDLLFKRGTEMIPFVMRETYEEDDNTSYDAMYLGSPGIPESATKNEQKYIERVKDLSNEQSSLQLPSRGVLPAPAPVPSGVQTASVDSAGSGSQRPQSIAASSGISKIDPQRARAFFDSPGEITFAARGGEMRSGIGGLFR